MNALRRSNEFLSEGAIIYFLDPNGHKLEFHVGDWRSRLKAWREQAKPGVQFFD